MNCWTQEVVRVYGRMQFADYIVSSALQSLARSLKRVSQPAGHGSADGAAGGLSCSNETSLELTAERLLSLWQMAQWSVGKVQFKRAQSDLREIIELCNSGRTPELLAVERLVERADPKSARLLGALTAPLQHAAPKPRTPAAERRDRLDTLLQDESVRWREYAFLRQIEQTELIEQGILRAFGKAFDLSRKLERVAAGGAGRASAKRLLRAERWTRHSVNHLELLRPALSDSGRTRRWHLNRLAAKLRDQWALERLVRHPLFAELSVDLKPKAFGRLNDLVDDQRLRLDKQRQKLSVGAFVGGIDVFRQEVTEAVAKLGLESITLLPLETGQISRDS